MSDQDRISRGHKATSELEITAEAFEGVRHDLIRRMVETPVDQVATILQFHAALQTLGRVRHAMNLVVQDGQVAAQAVAMANLARG